MHSLLEKLSVGALVIGLGQVLAAPVLANDYPTRVIRILVPFSPGGSTDLLARGLARHFQEVWKQPVVIDNKPGAGGAIAFKDAVSSPADGYTLVAHSDGFAIAPAMLSRLPYDSKNDFKPVAILARAPNVLVVSPSGPYTSVADLVKAGRTVGGLSYSSAGVGGAQHMQAAKFSAAVGLNAPVHVPFRGTPESLTEVATGRVDFVFAPLSTAMPMIKDKILKPLAISTDERSELLKGLPTIQEAGVRGFDERQWWALFVNSKVPSKIIQKIETETRIALQTPELLKLIEFLSSTPGDLSGNELVEFVNKEIDRNIIAAKAAGIDSQ